MISSEKEYLNAMRDMICKVQAGYEPTFSADAQELEIFSDCIKNGYLIGRVTHVDRDGKEKELRTLDGKMHPELFNHVIPPKGLAFLKPNRTNTKATIAIFTSIFASIISLFALIVSLLSNLDKILANLEILRSLLG